jgi:hypothetical protein
VVPLMSPVTTAEVALALMVLLPPPGDAVTV